jgi:hypothetical protein
MQVVKVQEEISGEKAKLTSIAIALFSKSLGKWFWEVGNGLRRHQVRGNR